jgi:hypothetical protein
LIILRAFSTPVLCGFYPHAFCLCFGFPAGERRAMSSGELC